MSKQKNASANGTAVAEAPVTQLTLLNFDDDALLAESVEATQSEPAPAAEPAPVETEESVLAAVPSFEKEFETDPLKAKMLAWATRIQRETSNTEDAFRRYAYGIGAMEILNERYGISPGSYDRAKNIKLFDVALTLCNVDVGSVKPQELIQVYWLAQLLRSEAPAEGEPRTYPSDKAGADFFTGNLHYSALRVLAKGIYRVSKDTKELELWDFKEGYEAKVREYAKRLQAGTLAFRQAEDLMDFRKRELANERKAAKLQGLNAAEKSAVEEAEANANLRARLKKLGELALGVQDYAANELKKGKADLRDFLANTGIIPPLSFDPVEIAKRMTKGDAKALVQALITQSKDDPSRVDVFRALYGTARAIVNQIESARKSKAA
jgi:hypothetical protein